MNCSGGSMPDLTSNDFSECTRSQKIWISPSSISRLRRASSHPSIELNSSRLLLADFKSALSSSKESPPSRRTFLLTGLALLTLSTSCFDLLGPSILFLDAASSSLLLSSSFLGAALLSAIRLPVGLTHPCLSAILLVPFLGIHFLPCILNLLPAYAILGGWILLLTLSNNYSEASSVHFVGALGLGSSLSGAIVVLSLQLIHSTPSPPTLNFTVGGDQREVAWWMTPLPLTLTYTELSVLSTLLIIISSFGALLLYLSLERKASHHTHPQLIKKSNGLNYGSWAYYKRLSLSCATGMQRALIAQTFFKELLLSKFGLHRTCVAVGLFGASLAFNSWLLKNILKYFSFSIVICLCSIFEYSLLYVLWNQLLHDGSKGEDVNTYFACASVWGSVSAVLEYSLLESTWEFKDGARDGSILNDVNGYRFLSASFMYSCRIFCSERQKVLLSCFVYSFYLFCFLGSKSGEEKNKSENTSSAIQPPPQT